VRAYVITSPKVGSVVEVPEPTIGAEDLLVQVERAGICGTDVEFFSGEMAYLASGEAHFPLRIGHEWCGRVLAVGGSVDSTWIGKLVTSDTMLGCQECNRCQSGYQYLCAERNEVGIRRGFPGALAEKIVIPSFAVYELPGDMDPALGAMVEPTGNALRAVDATKLKPGERLLIFGPGTIGLLSALIAQSRGIEVHIVGVDAESIEFARQFGFAGVYSQDAIPKMVIHSIIDATYGDGVPVMALELIEPGRAIVLIGIAGTPSMIDSRILVLKDLKVTGILSASPGLQGAIQLLSEKKIDPSPLIAGVINLEDTGEALSGNRSKVQGNGPKIQIKP
jgi:threonine dehydrogenase-like Zn-dependent dehydrogenase